MKMLKYGIILLLFITYGINEKPGIVADALKVTKRGKIAKRLGKKSLIGKRLTPTEKGYFGEKFTVSIMERNKNYIEQKIKILKKNDKGKEIPQGIDHVYFKRNPKTKRIDEILIIESKCDTSKLAKGQMADKWIIENLKKLEERGDNQSQKVAKIILDNQEKIKKMQFHHDTKTGITKKTPIDKDGKLLNDQTEITYEAKEMKRELKDFCSRKGKCSE